MDSKPRRWDLIVLAICCVVFFVSSGVLSFGVPWVFNAPDENANAFFAETMRIGNHLSLSDPANIALEGIMHPRSVIAVGRLLVPGSFVGLPVVYGLVGKVIGLYGMRLLTLLLAVLAVFAWRSVIEKLFASRRIALIASLALLFHPAFWYYSARSMMHNVPFVALLIFDAYFLFKTVTPSSPQRSSPPLIKGRLGWVYVIAAGVCLGLAVWFRTIEVVWIVPAATVLLVAHRRTLGWRSIFILAATFAVTLVPLLVINQQLYGNPLTTGYTYHAAASTTIAAPSSEIATTFDPLQPNARTILKHVWQYGTVLFPWMSFAALVGFAIAWRKKTVPRAYLWLTLGVSAWLFAFYGSWIFHDNPDPALATIGTSYVRYWLPIFVLVSPFVAQTICWLADVISSPYQGEARRGLYRWVASVVTLIMITANVYPVFFAADGLIGIRQNLFTYADERSQIMQATEANAIVIVDRADKFLWPYRRVVQPLRSEVTYAAMPALALTAPLYYFGITFPQTDLDYLNTVKLPPYGLGIELVQTIGEESLYRIYARP